MKWELLVCALVFGCSGEAGSVHQSSGEVEPVGVNSDGEQSEPAPTQVAVEMPPVQAADPIATSEPAPMPTSEPVVDSEPPAMTAEPEPEQEPMPEPEPEPEPEPTVVPTAEPPPDVPPEEPRCDYAECYGEATAQVNTCVAAVDLDNPCERLAAERWCSINGMRAIYGCAEQCLGSDAIPMESSCNTACHIAVTECIEVSEPSGDNCDNSGCASSTGLAACIVACHCEHNENPQAGANCDSPDE